MSDDRHELNAALGVTPDCPSIEQLGRFAEDGLDASQRANVESHIGRCGHCQSELALLRQFTEVSLQPEEERPVAWIAAQLHNRAQEIYEPSSEARPARVSWWKRLFATPVLSRAALALGCLLIIVSGSIYLRRGSAPALNTTLDSGPEVLRSNTVELLSPKGTLTAPPELLQWQAMPGAERYQVRILEVDRTELWKSETSAVTIKIPDQVRALVKPGKTLLWHVTALDTSGKQLASSNFESFRVGQLTQQKNR